MPPLRPSWRACQKHPTRRPGPPSPSGSSPTSSAAGPTSASPSCATAGDSATSTSSCPATASPRRSCACATRDQLTAGPSVSTWPAATGTARPSCRPLSAPRPAPLKKASMTPSSSTRAPKLAADRAFPRPKVRNTSAAAILIYWQFRTPNSREVRQANVLGIALALFVAAISTPVPVLMSWREWKGSLSWKYVRSTP
jgi:hypothetical protein